MDWDSVSTLVPTASTSVRTNFFVAQAVVVPTTIVPTASILTIRRTCITATPFNMRGGRASHPFNRLVETSAGTVPEFFAFVRPARRGDAIPFTRKKVQLERKIYPTSARKRTISRL